MSLGTSWAVTSLVAAVSVRGGLRSRALLRKAVSDLLFPKAVHLAKYVERLQMLSHREVAPALEVRQIAI